MNRLLAHITILLSLLAFQSMGQTSSDLLQESDDVYDSENDRSYDLAIQAEKLAIEENDSINIARAIAFQARYILLKGNVEKANELLSRSLRIINDESKAAYIYLLKSIVMGRLGEDEESLRYSEKVVEIELRQGDTATAVLDMLNLSVGYLEVDQPDKCKETLNTIERHFDQLSESNKYYFYQNKGTYFSYIGKYDRALTELKKARDLAFELDKKDSQCTIILIIGETHLKMGNAEEAIRMLKWSRDLSRQYELVYEELEAIVALSKAYEAVGDYKKAHNLYKRQVQIDDSLHGAESVQRVADMERELEREQQARKIAEKDATIEAEQLRVEASEARNQLLIYVAIGLVLIIGIVFYTWNRTRSLNKVISKQKGLLEEKNDHLETALKDIHDSFRYGRRLQQAFLPSIEEMKSTFTDSFVLYKSKDIVSGDFYWMWQKDNRVYFAVGDCTGHGVPGAMLSVVGANGLNQCLEQEGITEVNEILDRLRVIVKESFSSNEKGIADGMDISLCCWDKLQGTISFAGANNPLWLIRGKDQEFIDIRGDRQPIGAFARETPFTKHEFHVEAGDSIYLFSDGFQDQFGGEFGKKLKTGNFKKLVLSNHDKRFEQQKIDLSEFFKKWQGTMEQVDDVCIFGVKL